MRHQPPHATARCGLRSVDEPRETGIVAVWRIKTHAVEMHTATARVRGLDPSGFGTPNRAGPQAPRFLAGFFPPVKMRLAVDPESSRLLTARGRVCSPLPDNHHRIRLAPRRLFTFAVARWFMVHVPDWERLADALKRVAATGITENEAKVAICGAISDRNITVRLFIGRFERADIFLLEGWERDVPPSRTLRDFALWQSALTGLPPRQPSLMIPRHDVLSKRLKTPLIVPGDFDWLESRPLKPWRDAQGLFSLFDWRGDRIEICSADVTRVLIAPRSVASKKVREPSGKRAAVTKTAVRISPKREQARIALREVYSDRIPDRIREPDAVLVRKIADLVKKKFGKEFVVSADTILRAAGRRKDHKGHSRHG